MSEEDGGEEEDRGNLVESSSVWRYAMADRAKLVIDADGYFELVREAMMAARQRIFMIGWDFDTRIHLAAERRTISDENARIPTRLGPFVRRLAKRNRKLEIMLLKWNISLFKSLFRGRMMIDLARWAWQKNITFKFDSAHPTGASHHQKVVVIDDKLAVCGGIDMTSDRWDTRDHLHEDIRRKLPNGRPYDPWHDMTMMMEGEVAQALAELGRNRWELAGGDAFEPCEPQDHTPWPERLRADFENVEFGIARTRAEHGEANQISEIESLFVKHIMRAKRFIYAETQYFASRKITEAIARRLDEDDPPEIIILNPRHADGWLEQQAMDSARARLVDCVKERDHADRFRLYIPYTSGGTPIYVHAKLTIIDDEVIRVGSANMNNRSMGLDSECDVFLDMDRPANKHIGPTITRIRHSLIAEHCGLDEREVGPLLEKHGSMRAMIDALPKEGRCLKHLPDEDLNDVEEMIADTSLLDPERPDEMFEPLSRRGLFRSTGTLFRPGSLKRRSRKRRG